MTEKTAIKQFESDCPRSKVLDYLFQQFDCKYEPNKFDHKFDFICTAQSEKLRDLLWSEFQYQFDNWHDNYISSFYKEHDK